MQMRLVHDNSRDESLMTGNNACGRIGGGVIADRLQIEAAVGIVRQIPRIVAKQVQTSRGVRSAASIMRLDMTLTVSWR